MGGEKSTGRAGRTPGNQLSRVPGLRCGAFVALCCAICVLLIDSTNAQISSTSYFSTVDLTSPDNVILLSGNLVIDYSNTTAFASLSGPVSVLSHYVACIPVAENSHLGWFSTLFGSVNPTGLSLAYSLPLSQLAVSPISPTATASFLNQFMNQSSLNITLQCHGGANTASADGLVPFHALKWNFSTSIPAIPPYVHSIFVSLQSATTSNAWTGVINFNRQFPNNSPTAPSVLLSGFSFALNYSSYTLGVITLPPFTIASNSTSATFNASMSSISSTLPTAFYSSLLQGTVGITLQGLPTSSMSSWMQKFVGNINGVPATLTSSQMALANVQISTLALFNVSSTSASMKGSLNFTAPGTSLLTYNMPSNQINFLFSLVDSTTTVYATVSLMVTITSPPPSPTSPTFTASYTGTMISPNGVLSTSFTGLINSLLQPPQASVAILGAQASFLMPSGATVSVALLMQHLTLPTSTTSLAAIQSISLSFMNFNLSMPSLQAQYPISMTLAITPGPFFADLGSVIQFDSLNFSFLPAGALAQTLFDVSGSQFSSDSGASLQYNTTQNMTVSWPRVPVTAAMQTALHLILTGGTGHIPVSFTGMVHAPTNYNWVTWPTNTTAYVFTNLPTIWYSVLLSQPAYTSIDIVGSGMTNYNGFVTPYASFVMKGYFQTTGLESANSIIDFGDITYNMTLTNSSSIGNLTVPNFTLFRTPIQYYDFHGYLFETYNGDPSYDHSIAVLFIAALSNNGTSLAISSDALTTNASVDPTVTGAFSNIFYPSLLTSNLTMFVSGCLPGDGNVIVYAVSPFSVNISLSINAAALDQVPATGATVPMSTWTGPYTLTSSNTTAITFTPSSTPWPVSELQVLIVSWRIDIGSFSVSSGAAFYQNVPFISSSPCPSYVAAPPPPSSTPSTMPASLSLSVNVV